MIFPINTTIYQPTYIHHDSTSDTQKCLEIKENFDILQKTLKSEELNDSDTERITSCIEDRNRLAMWVVLGVIIFIIGLGIFFWRIS